MKKITSRCTVCRRYEGRGFKVPPQPDLPEFRIQNSAFTYVGVDYAGPLYIKELSCSTTKKVYILLFTCCSTRAVDLELATDLSADMFIRCLWRFTARRGLPEIIVSDNAKTFKSAAKVLQKVFSYPSVKRFLANRRIMWKFNMDRAPWWGGFFKRMIQNAKQSLGKTLRNAKLDYDELHTILVMREINRKHWKVNHHGIYLKNRVFSTWRKVRAEGTFANDSNFASWLLGLELRRRREQ